MELTVLKPVGASTALGVTMCLANASVQKVTLDHFVKKCVHPDVMVQIVNMNACVKMEAHVILQPVNVFVLLVGPDWSVVIGVLLEHMVKIVVSLAIVITTLFVIILMVLVFVLQVTKVTSAMKNVHLEHLATTAQVFVIAKTENVMYQVVNVNVKMVGLGQLVKKGIVLNGSMVRIVKIVANVLLTKHQRAILGQGDVNVQLDSMVNNVRIHALSISGEKVAKMCAIALTMPYVRLWMALASAQPVIMVKTVVSLVPVDSTEKTVR